MSAPNDRPPETAPAPAVDFAAADANPHYLAWKGVCDALDAAVPRVGWSHRNGTTAAYDAVDAIRRLALRGRGVTEAMVERGLSVALDSLPRDPNASDADNIEGGRAILRRILTAALAPDAKEGA